jgi:hypothetical protein
MRIFLTIVFIIAVRAFAFASTSDSIPGDSCGVYVPNSISMNDETWHGPLWLKSNCPIADLEFILYDRWGNKLFTGTRLDKNGFLPADLSKIMADVYVYTLRFTRVVNGKEEKKKFSGHITVVN